MLFSNLHSHHTCEGRGFYPSCYLFHACACLLCVYVFEGFLGYLCFVGFGWEGFLDVLMLFSFPLRLFHVGFHGLCGERS